VTLGVTYHITPWSTTVNHCQQVPTPADHCQPLSTTVNHCQQTLYLTSFSKTIVSVTHIVLHLIPGLLAVKLLPGLPSCTIPEQQGKPDLTTDPAYSEKLGLFYFSAFESYLQASRPSTRW
jgi:hypothetical protein